VREIPLTEGHVALVDEADYEAVAAYRWRALIRPTSRTVYAQRVTSSDGKKSTLLLHRFLVKAPKGLEVDHIDGNGLNNTRANLRVGTHAENMRNRRRRCDNSSGYIGVHWHKRDRKWVARITLHGKLKSLGYFDTPEDAARARDAAAIELHGEYARLNFQY